jgi:hypothetical protein
MNRLIQEINMMKCLFRTAGILVLMALASSVAHAQAPGYGYIEGGYLNVNPDNFSGSGDSWYGEASMGLFKNFHLSGRYLSGNYADNVDLSLWRFAAGWHGMLGEKGDVVAEATWTNQEVDNESDDGVGITGGVRWRFIKMFELDGFVHWTDYGTAGSTDSYEVRAIVDVWRLGLGAAYEMSSDDNRYNAFVRFNFGKD